MLPFLSFSCSTHNSENEQKRALRKIAKLAVSISATNFTDRIAVEAFQGTLSPSQFKAQLTASFPLLHLTPKEAGAVMDFFDDDNSGSIEGSEVYHQYYDYDYD